ncbi:MAG: response regulator [Burkholderiales bacterium]|nr:response regulator [Burkholderiales bacterium]
MPEKNGHEIHDEDVFALTAKGQNELRGSATWLAPPELELLILIDGKSTVAETAARARSIGSNVAVTIFGRLAQEGLIEAVKDPAGSFDLVDFFQTTGPLLPAAQASAKAQKEAVATASLLQQQGYFVRIARRASTRKKGEDLQALLVLVVEDETHLANLLKHVLADEGYTVRIAKNRAELLAELRRAPRPDLVLLDVLLPDVDGFEVLLKIREHPSLRTVPVVMLTAKATRDAVLKGLAGGADGYITKPFEIDVLTKAVKVVLGLSEGGGKPGVDQDPWPG